MPQDRTISQEGFQTLLGWLDTNVESAGEKYEKIRQRLIRIFVGRGCYEAEMLADETIDRVTSKIPELNSHYVGEPATYFYGVANKVHLEWLRKQRREREAVFIDTTSEAEEGEAEYTCLETCLEKLEPRSRELILEYYRDEKREKIERRKRLAESLGITIGALQIKVSRIRSQLSACVHECVAGK